MTVLLLFARALLLRAQTVPLLGSGAPAQVRGTPLQGGVFVLANTILGAGMLGLPFAFAACGFLVGPIMLAAFACCSITALVLLSECADAVGRPATFNTVAEKALPGSGLAISFAVAIKCFGVATSYLIVIGDSVPKSVVALGGSGLLVRRQVWTLAALAIAAPLAYMRKITALRNVSMVALGCVLGITVMIVCFALFGDSAEDGLFDPCPSVGAVASSCPPGKTQLITSSAQVLRALPLFVFSYTCHQNIFAITNELHQPTRLRNASVAAFAVCLALGVYILLGSSGYTTFGSKVQHDILANYPSSNALVAVARLAISFVVTCCYPLQAHPTRENVKTIVNAVFPNAMTDDTAHLIVTTVFVTATAIIACTVDDLGLVLSVVGATGSTIVSYILPGESKRKKPCCAIHALVHEHDLGRMLPSLCRRLLLPSLPESCFTLDRPHRADHGSLHHANQPLLDFLWVCVSPTSLSALCCWVLPVGANLSAE